MEKSKVYFTDFRARLGEGLPTKLKRLMKKAGFASTLTAVPGIGEQRAAKLLKHFKSMAAIRTADVETLAKAPGMSRPAAEALYQHLHGEETAEN